MFRFDGFRDVFYLLAHLKGFFNTRSPPKTGTPAPIIPPSTGRQELLRAYRLLDCLAVHFSFPRFIEEGLDLLFDLHWSRDFGFFTFGFWRIIFLIAIHCSRLNWRFPLSQRLTSPFETFNSPASCCCRPLGAHHWAISCKISSYSSLGTKASYFAAFALEA